MKSLPIEFVDGLVKGLIEGFYDFCFLVCTPIVFPFISSGKKRFWRYLLKREESLSSTTCLVICVTILIIVINTHYSDAAKAIAGIKLPSPGDLATDIACAVFLAMVLNVTVKVSIIISQTMELHPPRYIESLANLGISFYFIFVLSSAAFVLSFFANASLQGINLWFFLYLDSLIGVMPLSFILRRIFVRGRLKDGLFISAIVSFTIAWALPMLITYSYIFISPVFKRLLQQ